MLRDSLHCLMTPRQFSIEDSLPALIHDCILQLLSLREPEATICPSEVARALGDELDVEWRDLMRLVREVTANLHAEGRIEVLQAGLPVDIRKARGPVRLRLRHKHDRGQ